MQDPLKKKIADAVADPVGAAGRRLGPTWGRGNDGYAREQETMPEWIARAVTATIEAEGRLLPGDGRLATLMPPVGNRGTTLVIQVESPRDIFRFMVNQFSHQVEYGAAARGVLVDLRDSMGHEQFDHMARTLLVGDAYERLHGRFERHWDCRSCEITIRDGGRYFPTRDAGAVCARCCKGYPEYETQLVKRVKPAATKAKDGEK